MGGQSGPIQPKSKANNPGNNPQAGGGNHQNGQNGDHRNRQNGDGWQQNQGQHSRGNQGGPGGTSVPGNGFGPGSRSKSGNDNRGNMVIIGEGGKGEWSKGGNGGNVAKRTAISLPTNGYRRVYQGNFAKGTLGMQGDSGGM